VVPHLVKPSFRIRGPDQLWLPNTTSVSTWPRLLYVAVVRPSTGGVGDICDDVMCESSSATLERELIDHRQLRSPRSRP
jgi:hypothetical protein